MAEPTTTAAPGRSAGWYVALALLIAAAFVIPIGWSGLSEPDEARYAEIAREMRESGDWVTPRLNYLKYMLKPPLVYWLTAASHATFGEGEAASRVVPVGAGLLCVLCIGLIGAQMAGRRGAALAALVLATSPFFYALSLVLTLDVPLAAAVTAALTAFWLGYRRPSWRRLSYLLLYAATALGVLVKGPVATVLVGGTIVIFLALRREWSEIREVVRLEGILLALLIALPWFLAISWQNPEFPEFFVVRQHFDRYTNWGEHPRPWWFYVPILLGGMLPWPIVAALSAERRLSGALRSAEAQFCAVWALWVLVFYSIPTAKIGNYVLPMMPPLALLFAAAFLEWRQRLPRALLATAWLFGGLGALCLLAAPVLGAGWPDARVSPLWPTLLGAGAVLLVLNRAVIGRLRAGQTETALTALGVGMCVFLVVGLTGRRVVSEYSDLGNAIAALAPADALVVSYGQYVPGISYYTERRVIGAINWGDLESCRRHGEDDAFFWLTDADVARGWAGARQVFLVVNRSEVPRLRGLLRPPVVEVAAQGKKVALSNR